MPEGVVKTQMFALILKNLFRWASFYVLGTGVILSSCMPFTQDSTVEIKIQESVAEDKEYFQAYKMATRESKVYTDFETKVILYATYLTPDFKMAFHRRMQRIFDQAPPIFDRENKQSGFFVSIYAPDEEKVKLNDADLWSAVMVLNGQKYLPIRVQKLEDKERWKTYFHKVNGWSHEYLVLFDIPAVDPNSEKMLKKVDVELTLSNPDVQILMKW